MPSGYTHQTRDYRSQVYILRKNRTSHRVIAKPPGVSPSTVSREIRRNLTDQGYRIRRVQE